MRYIQYDPILISDLADARKRTELLKNPRAFLEQYGIGPEQTHTSSLMSRLPGLTDAHGHAGEGQTVDSIRPTSSLSKALDPHWQ